MRSSDAGNVIDNHYIPLGFPDGMVEVYSEDLTSIVRGWCWRYGVAVGNMSVSWSNLGGSTLGRCYCDQREKLRDGTFRRVADIRVHEILAGHPFAVKSVLWHEFCNGERWINGHMVDGYGHSWDRGRWRRPILTLVGTIYTKILFFTLKSRE